MELVAVAMAFDHEMVLRNAADVVDDVSNTWGGRKLMFDVRYECHSSSLSCFYVDMIYRELTGVIFLSVTVSYSLCVCLFSELCLFSLRTLQHLLSLVTHVTMSWIFYIVCVRISQSRSVDSVACDSSEHMCTLDVYMHVCL